MTGNELPQKLKFGEHSSKLTLSLKTSTDNNLRQFQVLEKSSTQGQNQVLDAV